MSSLGKKTKRIRKNKRVKSGQARKKAVRKKGSTPAFPIHIEAHKHARPAAPKAKAPVPKAKPAAAVAKPAAPKPKLAAPLAKPATAAAKPAAPKPKLATPPAKPATPAAKPAAPKAKLAKVPLKSVPSRPTKGAVEKKTAGKKDPGSK